MGNKTTDRGGGDSVVHLIRDILGLNVLGIFHTSCFTGGNEMCEELGDIQHDIQRYGYRKEPEAGNDYRKKPATCGTEGPARVHLLSCISGFLVFSF